MTDEEKDEYGKQWPYGTTDETKENASDGANEAGLKQPPRDPLVIDLGKKGIELTNVDGRVHFDLDKNGFSEKTAWIGTEDGFLALDRNGNGIIDDGGELFGDQVDLAGRLAASGFEALKQLDDNVNSETGEIGDGVIDKNKFHYLYFSNFLTLTDFFALDYRLRWTFCFAFLKEHLTVHNIDYPANQYLIVDCIILIKSVDRNNNYT